MSNSLLCCLITLPSKFIAIASSAWLRSLLHHHVHQDAPAAFPIVEITPAIHAALSYQRSYDMSAAAFA